MPPRACPPECLLAVGVQADLPARKRGNLLRRKIGLFHFTRRDSFLIRDLDGILEILEIGA